MDWNELKIPDPPKTDNVQLNVWLTQISTHLRKYLGGLELNDSIGNDAGDPSAVHFDVSDLTTDGGTYDLDLSGYGASGAKLFYLYVKLDDGLAGVFIAFRKNGNSNWINKSIVSNHVANIPVYSDILVFCDSDMVVEYQTSNTTFTTIDITVKGYLM